MKALFKLRFNYVDLFLIGFVSELTLNYSPWFFLLMPLFAAYTAFLEWYYS